MIKPAPPLPRARNTALRAARVAKDLEDQFTRLASENTQLKPLELERGGIMSAWRLTGAAGGGESIRLGFFAGLHGDEPAGCVALLRVAQELLVSPEKLAGYDLFIYPVCNRWGYERHLRHDHAGRDLNREFWRESNAHEVQVIEAEILKRDFSGIVSLHTDEDSHGAYGFVRGDVLAVEILEPALASAESVVPRNQSDMIDGFPARAGVIRECYEGVLTAPPRLARTPFEVIFESPGRFPVEAQARAASCAALTMLARYRELMAFGEGL